MQRRVQATFRRRALGKLLFDGSKVVRSGLAHLPRLVAFAGIAASAAVGGVCPVWASSYLSMQGPVRKTPRRLVHVHEETEVRSSAAAITLDVFIIHSQFGVFRMGCPFLRVRPVNDIFDTRPYERLETSCERKHFREMTSGPQATSSSMGSPKGSDPPTNAANPCIPAHPAAAPSIRGISGRDPEDVVALHPIAVDPVRALVHSRVHGENDDLTGEDAAKRFEHLTDRARPRIPHSRLYQQVVTASGSLLYACHPRTRGGIP
ncbi:hypothetical protein BJ912DRAFT_1044724 [Pholiota molesta]|nr:hypothetical protein BJ912DRAFT_1044724 [Pholiota molesta]